MPLLGLIGYPLEHSFSPGFFREKFRAPGLESWDYRLFPLQDISELRDLLAQHTDLIGLNVTIPYKQAVLDFCRFQSADVRAIGAANCIRINRTHKVDVILEAFNTDFGGWKESVKPWYVPSRNRALVLGSGGSSRAVCHALVQMNILYDVAGRQADLNYGNLSLKHYDLIVNCTPAGTAGMEPRLLPLPYQDIDPSMFFYDLVYNPGTTPMMEEFMQRGAQVKNGLEMLYLQAEASWKIFIGE